MKSSYSYLIVLAVLAGFSMPVAAQIDTVFWFATPWVTPDHDGNVQLAYRISTFDNPATVRIQQPAMTYDTTFVIPANSLASIPLNHMVNSLESKPANVVLTKGVKISSDELITVVYDFISDMVTITPGTPNNPETYSLKGQNGMGKEFVVPFQTKWNNQNLTIDRNADGVVTQPYQYFSVVATEANTTIYITPRCNVVGGHPANVTYSVFLPQAGSVYTCQNITQLTNVAGNNLSGSIVVSDKPVSVTINDDSVNPSGGGGCHDLMGDQIVPTDVIGSEYIINKGFLNVGSNESVFLIAAENFTTITLNNGLTTTSQMINQGETWQYSITQPLTYINATKPIYVIHMSGYGCELGLAIIPPLNCAGSDVVAFSRNNNQQFLLNILCQAPDVANFQLNGNAALVPPGAFSPVPGTAGAWMGAQIDYPLASIPAGSSNLLTNSSGLFAVGVINGGATTGCLYHYMSSFNRKVYTDAGSDTILCNGEPLINLNGTVSGGSSTGVWTVLNGTGTINNPSSLMTTYTPTVSDYNQGGLTFVLASTGNCDPVTDTVTVEFIQSPVVLAGPDESYCKNNVGAIPVTGSVNFASAGVWSGGNGGAFGNPGSLTTTYTPSPADIAQDSVVLFLTSAGSFFACPNDEDTLVLYFTEPPVVSAGADLVLCSSQQVINLNGLVSGATNTGVWSTSNGAGAFSPSAANPITNYLVSAADTTAGNISLTLTSTNNGTCLAEQDSIQITFLSNPVVTILSEDSLCSTSSLLNLDGFISSGYTPTWNTNGFGIIVSSNAISTQYAISPVDTAQGYIDLFLTSNAGICPVEQDSIRVYFIDPPYVFAGADQQFCSNELVQLSGVVSGSGSSGSWSSMGTGTFTPGNNFLVTGYQPSASDIAAGMVTLILGAPGAFGCPPVDDQITISFKPSPNAMFNATTSCFGDNSIFTDASAVSSGSVVLWNWNFGDGQSSITQDPIHSFGSSGTYNVTLIVGSNNGCYDTISSPVTVNPVPIADFSPTVACENTAIDFTDLSFISSGTIATWEYDFGTATSNEQNPSYLYTNSGNQIVTLTATTALGCSDDTTMVITVYPAPVASFTHSPSLAVVLQNVNFTDLSSGFQLSDWYWEFGDGQANNAQNPVHSYAEGGTYEVTLVVTDGNGCSDTAKAILPVALPPVLPTGFTPNGDGENDEFIIRGGPFKAVDFKVYNNWGELVFSTTDGNSGWKGDYNGNPSPMGVYTWTFVVTMANDQVVKKSGDVTLIR